MNLVRILIIVGALAFAGIAFFVVSRFIGGGSPPATQQAAAPPKPTAEDVLVAAKDLPAGDLLADDDVRWQRWSEDAIDPNYFVREKGADPKKVAVGFIVLHGIDAGVPLTAQRLLKPGEGGFLAADLAPGMRAVTVRIDVLSSDAGLILPQDHVDVMLYEQYPIAVSAAVTQASQNLPQVSRRDVASIVVQDVPVLAIDGNFGTAAADPNKPRPPAANATLEVTLDQAEKISVAQNLGLLSLILRSHTRSDKPDGAAPIVQDFQASPYRGAVVQQINTNVATSGENDNVRIYRGAELAGAKQ